MRKRIKRLFSVSPYGIYEFFRDLRTESKKLKIQHSAFKNYLALRGERKLHIGCGSNLLSGWLNTDLNWDEKITYLNAAKNFPLPNNTFDFIYSEHLFEHLNEEQQMNMLTECLRILKENGILRIATPSLKFLFELYGNQNNELNSSYINWAMNHSTYLRALKDKTSNSLQYPNYVINHFFKAWGHKMIHDEQSLVELGRYCGFSEMKFFAIGESEHPQLKNIEKHDTIIPQEMNSLETMVLELKK